MTELQIQYFLMVAREQSVSRAAEILYVSQPAISRQLSQLENELGVPLFNRRPQSMELTDAGKAFEKLFNEFNTRFQETMEIAKNKIGGAKMDYYLGCLDGWDISAFGPELFAYMEQRFPNVRLHMTGYDIDHILHAIRRGEADGVITTANLFDGVRDIRIDPIADVNAVLLFSARNPLASKENLKLWDFKDYPFYITAPQGMKNALDDLITVCKAGGFMPKIEYANTLSATYMKMHMGRGAFLANDWILSKHNPAFGTLNLNYKRKIGLASLETKQDEAHEEIRNEIVKFFQFRAT